MSDDTLGLADVTFIELRWEVQGLGEPETGCWRRTILAANVSPEKMTRAVNAAIEQFRIALKDEP